MRILVNGVRLFFDVEGAALVLAGDRDPATPLADAEEIAAHLPPDLLRYEAVRGAGHGPHRDRPSETEAILRAFMRADPGAPATRLCRFDGEASATEGSRQQAIDRVDRRVEHGHPIGLVREGKAVNHV